MAAEVWWVLISTSSFQVFWGLYFVSQALDLLSECVFLHATWVGLCLGVLNPVFQLRRVGVWPLSLYLTSRYEFVLWGGWISKYILNVHWSKLQVQIFSHELIMCLWIRKTKFVLGPKNCESQTHITYYSDPLRFIVWTYFDWIKGWANFEPTPPVHKKCVSLRRV